MRRQVLRSRRGESTIIANLILFVAVMGMAAVTVALFKSMLDQSSNAASAEKERTVNVLQTDFMIPTATYSAGSVTVYVKNTGDASFDPDEMDVYLDGLRIPRNESNRTVSVTADTDTVNTGVWDAGEELEFTVYRNYTVPATHTVEVFAPNGVSTENVFSS